MMKYQLMLKLLLKEFQNYSILQLVEWIHDKAHIHSMFKTQPKTELTKFIN